MADELRIGLQELLRKARIEHDADLLKEGVRVLSQALMEMEVEEHVGAARHERSTERTGQRNGYRQRSWDTRVGKVELKVPRVRDSSYFPSLLEPRRRAERALAAVVQEAYVHGVSTRTVDELVKALRLGRGLVAALPGALHEERPLFGLQAGPADGRRHHTHRVRPARGPKLPRAMATGLGRLALPISQALGADGSGRARRTGLRELPSGALAEGMVQQ